MRLLPPAAISPPYAVRNHGGGGRDENNEENPPDFQQKPYTQPDKEATEREQSGKLEKPAYEGFGFVFVRVHS
jgi:hypothetical protein